MIIVYLIGFVGSFLVARHYDYALWRAAGIALAVTAAMALAYIGLFSYWRSTRR